MEKLIVPKEEIQPIILALTTFLLWTLTLASSPTLQQAPSCIIWELKSDLSIKAYSFWKATPIPFHLLIKLCQKQSVRSESLSALYLDACFKVKKHCSVKCFYISGREIVKSLNWSTSALRAISRVDEGYLSKQDTRNRVCSGKDFFFPLFLGLSSFSRSSQIKWYIVSVEFNR